MIIDTLEHADFYFSLGKRIETGLRYLRDTDFSLISPGKIEIEGKNLYVSIQESVSKPLSEGKWEAHRKYLDIHYIISGKERIGYANVKDLLPGIYDEEKDLMFLVGRTEEGFHTLVPGKFAIMMPQDAHMPGIETDVSEPFKKAVIKIALD